MEPFELAILLQVYKEEFGLSLEEMQDPDQLRSLVQAKLAEMSPPDRFALDMKIGRRVQEARERLPGEPYSPPSRFLLAAAVLCLAISVGATMVIFKTEIWLVFKILVGIVGAWSFLLAWRAMARIVYRLVNHRDF